MPDNLNWLQPVLMAAAIVFVLDLIGNMLSFSNRFLNALVTAVLFTLIFGSLVHFGIVRLDVHTEMAPVSVPAAAPK